MFLDLSMGGQFFLNQVVSDPKLIAIPCDPVAEFAAPPTGH